MEKYQIALMFPTDQEIHDIKWRIDIERDDGDLITLFSIYLPSLFLEEFIADANRGAIESRKDEQT